MPETIYRAASADDMAAFAALIRDYVAWSRRRYEDDAWLIDAAFGHQALEDELRSLPAHYGPPDGATLLAAREGRIIACGAYRRRDGGFCEMKRLFVPERFRGRGTGRRLCQALIAAAGNEGYPVMRLDTGARLTEAIAMYRSLGFRDCAPYNTYPAQLMPHLRFMELPLKGPPRSPVSAYQHP